MTLVLLFLHLNLALFSEACFRSAAFANNTTTGTHTPINLLFNCSWQLSHPEPSGNFPGPLFAHQNNFVFSRHSKNISLHFKFTRKKRTRLAEINPPAAQKIQPELQDGETLRWAGSPNPQVIFHSDDWTSIPFSLLWTGFVICWECNALGLTGKSRDFDAFFVIWGIPFLLIGNYNVWGRFIHDAWLKRRTYYAITDRRAFVLQEGWVRKLVSTFIHELPTIEREGTHAGTLWLGPKYPIIGPRGAKRRSMSRFEVEDVPVFADIDDLDAVHRLLMELHYAGNGARDTVKPILSFPG